MFEAVNLYRSRFKPSDRLVKPYVMLGVNVVAAETDEEARFLASSGRQSFASLRQGRPTQLPPPSKEWEPDRTEPVDPVQRPRVSFVGSADTVAREMRDFISRTGADELIVVSHVYDHMARLRSYEIAAGLLTD
jgi:alkanesulfonate monooxygenase SsuD/methylene tetrahydromethanopterin reductase-like flavin-dependent oxidoreductase (luciferase family)